MSDDKDMVGSGLFEAISTALQAANSETRATAMLQDSFQSAVMALGAERAFLARIGPGSEVVEVLDWHGLPAHDVHAVRVGRSARGLSVSVLKRVLKQERALCVEDSRNIPDLARTLAFVDGQWSVICAPVCDPHTRLTLAVLYFQTESLSRPLVPSMVPHVNAYAAALAAAWGSFEHSRREVAVLREDVDQARCQLDADEVEILGESVQTEALRDLLDRVAIPSVAARRPDPILILGPTGSGKEVVARYLHRKSVRSRGPFVDLNCATFKGEILESKLFGHVKGAFTGAGSDADGAFVTAHKGVLFLDEVGDMPEDGQVMLLRALETRNVRPVGGRDERAVDVLVVCATNVDLEEAVRCGRFRSDLFHRLNGLTVRLTGLRERRADVKPLLAYYLAYHEQRMGKRTRGLTAEALEALQRYDWPGNVRELSRACSRLVLYAAPGGLLDMLLVARALPEVCAGPQVREEDAGVSPFEREFASFDEAMDYFGRQYLEIVDRKFQGNRSSMARYLRMSRSSLYHWLLRAGLAVRSSEGPTEQNGGGSGGEEEEEGGDDMSS